MASNEARSDEEATTQTAGPAYPGSLHAGQRIKDRYVIQRELGRGGFGAVYLAHDEELDSRRVVVKVLLDKGAEKDEWVLRKFQEEKQALARIEHPGVVGILDAGALPDGTPFLVMQFVDGVTLRSAMRAGQPLAFDRVASLLLQVGQALSAAHDRGVLHRDLKPENIMIQDLGNGAEVVKIIDFGIASVRSPDATSAIETSIAGSGPYMAPEQLRGKPGPASDIWALGVIAYEMLTGRRPFETASLAQLYFVQQEGVKIKPCDLRPDLPAAAQAAILRALSFEASDRCSRAREFGEDLARAFQGEKSSAPPPPPPPAPASEPALELAHVLYVDIVGFSLRSMEEQARLLQELQNVVRGTTSFRRAQASGDLLSLPTGDGMALVFWRDPVAPVECAVEIGRAVRAIPNLRLRSGVNTGPVYRVADVNLNKNVTGGGINLAQRVMDCGDAGHILVSRSVADVLKQLDQWSPYLKDLGESQVKHGVRVQVFNLCKEDAGNPAVPARVKTRSSFWKSAPIVAAALLLLGAGLWRWLPCEPELSFFYSIQVQQYRDKQPHGEPFLLPGEMLFPAGHRIRLLLGSSQPGSLYILNEGPKADAGFPSYVVLFPEAGGSASLAAGRRVEIPPERENWFVFDEQEGTERVWIVWALASVPELEEVKSFASARTHGLIDDRAQVEKVQAFFERHAASPAVVSRDESNHRTLVRGSGAVLVQLLKLEHH